MKNIKDMAVGIILSTAMLFYAVLPSGCNSNEAKDIEQIKDVTEQFVEAFGSGDLQEIRELTEEDFSYSIIDEENSSILLKIASKTEIKSYERVEIDRKDLTAKARIVISYIDTADFSKSMTNSYMSEEDYMNEIASYKDRKSANLTLNYIFDEYEGRWILKEKSADKYMKLFDRPYYLRVVSLSPQEASEIFKDVIEELAEGQFVRPEFELDFEKLRVFDDGVYDDPVLSDAIETFAKAYFSYIVEHGITIEEIDGNPYYVSLKGTAPSKDEILGYLSGEEHAIEYFMALIRSENPNSSFTEDEVWSSYYADIYFDLAKRIPIMNGEDYRIDLLIQYEYGDSPKVEQTYGAILPISEDEVYYASQISDDQAARCYQKAVESLYLAGELTQEEYEKYLSNINTVIGGEPDPDSIIVWEGTENHQNQAINVTEYIPDWSDGTLIYGKSDEDSYGFRMHYSKQPGWLDTAGYCIDDEGITIMVRFDRKFAAGTVLEFDWELNGDNVNGTQTFVVEENGQDTFEFTMPIKHIDHFSTCDFRLWEEGHSHVIAYVQLY